MRERRLQSICLATHASCETNKSTALRLCALPSHRCAGAKSFGHFRREAEEIRYKMFKEWFEVLYHSMDWDMAAGAPVEYEGWDLPDDDVPPN